MTDYLDPAEWIAKRRDPPGDEAMSRPAFTDSHIDACRCIWCASDPDKRRACGAPHPYGGRPCERPSGHTGGHGNAARAWLADS